jgi:hypothetical protein
MEKPNKAWQMQKIGRAGCPVLETTTRLGELSRDTVRTLRKLKRDLKACEKCPENDDCPILADFRSLVNTAIQEVTDEWNLGAINPPTT